MGPRVHVLLKEIVGDTAVGKRLACSTYRRYSVPNRTW